MIWKLTGADCSNSEQRVSSELITCGEQADICFCPEDSALLEWGSHSSSVYCLEKQEMKLLPAM